MQMDKTSHPIKHPPLSIQSDQWQLNKPCFSKNVGFHHSEHDKPGQHVLALFLDYSKAFDLVNYNILLKKLRDAGTPDCLVRGCAAVLFERQKHVKIGKVLSPLVTMKAGTHQGTFLGPLSFTVHLEDFR